MLTERVMRHRIDPNPILERIEYQFGQLPNDYFELKKLLEIAKGMDLSTVKRVGYLLDQYGKRNLTNPLHGWLKKQDSGFVLLQPGGKSSLREKNEKWGIIINEKVEPDI